MRAVLPRMPLAPVSISAATIALREVEIHLHLLGHVREAAIFDGAFEALSSRYGITTPPVFRENVLRRWPGSAALRAALGSAEVDALRRVGAGMTLDELTELIETTVAPRQVGQPAPLAGRESWTRPA